MYLYAKILPSQLGQPVPNSCLENFGFRYRTAGSLSESEGIKERKQLFFFLLVSICYVLLQSTPMTRDCVCVFFFSFFFRCLGRRRLTKNPTRQKVCHFQRMALLSTVVSVCLTDAFNHALLLPMLERSRIGQIVPNSIAISRNTYVVVFLFMSPVFQHYLFITS